MKVSVILPTYNEKESIGELISEVLVSVKPPLEIIVVDDCSPDGTWRIVEDVASRNPNVRLILRVGRKGLATAVAEGAQSASGEALIWMDCDLSQPPELIPKLIEALQDCDVALASRYVEGGGMRYHFTRRVTSRLVNLFAGLLLGFSTKDYTSGFLAVKRKVLEKVVIRSLGGGYGEYFIAFLHDAKKAGFRIREVPYTYVPRKAGLSKTSPSASTLLKHGFSYCRTIIALSLTDLKCG